ncbi:MAG: hypothetical protein P4M04_12470, partial [Acidobacteriota bacterium]|nr:hypothetical protein [Acidobacteriota bacterium]
MTKAVRHSSPFFTPSRWLPATNLEGLESMRTNFAVIAFSDSTATAEEVNARSDDNDRKGIAMREKLFKAVLMLVALLVLPGLAWSQDAQQNLTL